MFDIRTEETKPRRWPLVLAMGLVMILAGAAAIAVPVTGAVTFPMGLGVVFLVAAAAQIVRSLVMRGRDGFAMSLVTGLLYAAAAIMLLAFPGVLGITFLLGALLAAAGLFKIITALQMRPMRSWGWLIASAVVSIVLAALIFAQFPSGAFTVLGTFVGIDLIVFGLAHTIHSLSVRKMQREAVEEAKTTGEPTVPATPKEEKREKEVTRR